MNFRTIAILFLSGIVLASCSNGVNTNKKLTTELDSVSYSLGIDVAKNIQSGYVKELDYDAFAKGLKDVMEDNELAIDESSMRPIINAYFQKANQEAVQANLIEGREFLEENKTKEGVQVTESGLQYKVLEEGTGIQPVGTDSVVVHYTGTLIDGTVFDSSYDRGQPARFVLNQVIPGWKEGVMLMKEGAKYKLYLPTELAYATRVRQGGPIPPNAALIFEVELLEVIQNPVEE